MMQLTDSDEAAAGPFAAVGLQTLVEHAPLLLGSFSGPQRQCLGASTLLERALGGRTLPGRPLLEAVPELSGQPLVALLDNVARTGHPTVMDELPARLCADGRWEERFLWVQAQPLPGGPGGGVALFARDVTDQVELSRWARVAFTGLDRALRGRGQLGLREDGPPASSGTLALRESLGHLARHVVTELWPLCVVDLLEEDGTFHPGAAAHREAALHRQLPALRPVLTGRFTAEPWRTCVAERRTVVFELPHGHHATDAGDPVWRTLGVEVCALAPLVLSGRVLGTLLVGREEGAFGAEDLALLEALAARAVLGLEHARLRRDAEVAARARDEFLTAASHELKTPLTPLSLRIQSVARVLAGCPQLPFAERLCRDLDLMQRQVRRMGGFIDDLLDVARLRGGHFRLEREEVELGGLVREVASRFDAEVAQSGSPLLFELGSEPVVGAWDRHRVEQLVTHLLSNALKYGAGQPVRLMLARTAAEARLRVEDHGIGIRERDLSRVFGKYERAVHAPHFPGLGLGLYVSRQIAQGLGGDIEVESCAGQGSTFTVRLPLGKGPGEPVAWPTRAS